MARKLGWLAIVVAAAAGCAHGAPPAQAPAHAAQRSNVVIDQAVASGPSEVAGAWLLYGVRIAAAEKPHDFAAEVAARAALADYWKEQRAQGRHDPYLDALADVRAAGFIAEYTVAFLALPGWTVPAADVAKLNLDGFRRWARGHLRGHRPTTAVAVLTTEERPPVPGAELPANEDLDPRRVPCTALQPAIDDALRRWDADEAHLRPLPLSVSSIDQLLATFTLAARDPRARRDGIVLASPRVINAAFVAGFCAVDNGALADAERHLRRAVALAPGNANVRGELVQTLIMEKKLDDADAQLDVALEAANSACHSGVLWRKRGFILFDRGKLVESYKAYARSLEFDPGSAIARKEMQLITSTLRAAGRYDEKALESFKPPPPGELTVTDCK
jgi:tetratricopeptide (TPR) repeat protein